MASRKEIEDYILKWIDKITGGSKNNINLYKEFFKSMSDKEFDEWMQELKAGKKYIQIIVPNEPSVNDTNITIEGNLKLAKELNYDFFQRLIIGPVEDIPRYKTPEKYLILDLPFRRTKQIVSKKISVSENYKKIDMLTGQPKDESTAAKLSFPEMQVLVGMGLKDSVLELAKDRGGDITAARVFINSLIKTGRVSRKLTSMYSEGVLSTKTLQNYFTGMHLKANLT